MTKPILATCDHCHQITTVKFRAKNHPNDIKETYFKCIHCHYHYTSFVTDKWVRKMQRKLRQKGGRQNGRAQLQKDINSRMKDLKNNLINYGRADL